MGPSDITPATLPAIVRDPARRAALWAAREGERGGSRAYPPLANALSDAARCCVATPAGLEEMVELLLPEGAGDDVLDGLVFHPDLPDRCLFRMLDAGRCVSRLGHRRGPEGLLLRLAAEHTREAAEAVLTLALVHYGPDPARGERFLAFVREYLHVDWLRDSLRKSGLASTFPPGRLEAALKLADDYERAG